MKNENLDLNFHKMSAIEITDITCQILGLQQNHLLVAIRGNVASKETIHSSIFIRDIK